jgi:ParB-like chromosome segregation protein Spo0J
MEAASAVRKIPLDRLVPSPANTRKTPPSAAEDVELKASIKARGLKQNLVVCPSPEPHGLHAVTAGGGRLKVLQELAAEGVIPADYKLPCLVEEPAVETSLMENTVRVNRHRKGTPYRRLLDADHPLTGVLFACRFTWKTRCGPRCTRPTNSPRWQR